MTEGQQLLLVLAAIYLAECLVWVPRGGGFWRRGWRRWRWRGESPLRNDRGDGHFAGPLPPFRPAVVTRGLPFSLSPEGVLTWTAAALHPGGRPLQPARFVRWEELRPLSRANRRLSVGDTPLWTAASEAEAARLHGLLRGLRELPSADRAEAIRATLRASLDGARIQAELDRAVQATRWLRRAGEVFFMFLFLAMPLTFWRWGWFPALFLLLPALLAGTAAMAWGARRVHRRLLPAAGEERFRLTLVMALSPAAGVRAADFLLRPAVEEFHPLAAAAAWLPRGELEALAGAVWRDVRWPRLPGLPVPEAQPAEQWFRAAFLDVLRGWAARHGFDPADWEQPPAPTDPAHARCCPRCEAQYLATAEVCADCGGLPLRPLTPTGRTSPPARSPSP